VQFAIDTQPKQQFTRTRFSRVPVQLCKLAFQFGSTHVFVFRGVRISINAVALMLDRPQFGVALHHHIEDDLVFITELILTQPTQFFALVQDHLPAGLRELPSQNFHESGFAATVGTD